ncbi:MAG: lytic transglycosylase domain-containing protein [Nannocystales bacterium]
MVTRRLAIGLLFAAACAPTANPEPPASPQPVPVVQAEPAPAAAPAAEPEPSPAAEPEPEPTPAPEPEFEPLKLNAEQLARARKVQPLVVQASQDFGVDANLINGVIWSESKFNPKARNRSGAKGLMQLMPVTARGMGKKLDRRVRVYDPEFSIQAGTKLLSIMLERFDGDVELALFAFGRGGGRVRGWQANGETEMPKGVQRFIAKVRRGQKTFEMLGFPHV